MNTVKKSRSAGSSPCMGEPAHELGESPECDAGTQRPVGDGRLLGMREHLDQDHAGEPTLGDCITQFLADLALRVALRQSAQSTLSSYRSNLKHVPEDMRSRPVGAIRRADVRAWHKALAERRNLAGKRLTAAADNAVRTLNVVLLWVEDEELAVINVESLPTRRIRRVHVAAGSRSLGDQELEAWRDALDVHEHYRIRRVRGLRVAHPRLVKAYNPTVALRLLDLTGARSSEIRELRVENILWDRKLILLDRTKTGVGRARPLSSAALEELRRHLARLGGPQQGWIFPGRCGHPMSDSTMKRVFMRVCEVAGIERACRHSLRHTMVTRGFEAGFSSTGTSGAAGHAKEMSFAGYRHGVPGEAFQVVESHARRQRRAA